jgi:UDP-galactopyranose mutase
VVNFTHKGPFTRVVEWKNFPNHGQNEEFTTITYEEPCDYLDNDLERFYPVKDITGLNQDIYAKYQLIENQKVTFIGRLGLYQYLDMHQCINISLVTARKFIAENIIN